MSRRRADPRRPVEVEVVTMRDVAAEAGVSPMTVSNALTGRRPVSEQTRRRVLDTVERLGYQINVAARSLRQGRTGVVGIAVPVLDSAYFGFLAGQLSRRFAKLGLAAVVEETGASREGEIAAFRDSRLNAYDGLVISTVGLSEADLKAFSGELPVVVLGEQQLHQSVDHVSMANVEGAADATRLLLERGCRSVAMVGAPPLAEIDGSTINEGAAFLLRARGFRDVVAGAEGVTVTTSYTGSSTSDGAAAVADVLARRPDVDGIFCATDNLALGVLRGLADAGRRVPDDVLVIGFDDVRDSSFLVPSLSSVNPGHEEMISETVRLLVRRMADPAASPVDVTARHRVVERESTG